MPPDAGEVGGAQKPLGQSGGTKAVVPGPTPKRAAPGGAMALVAAALIVSLALVGDIAARWAWGEEPQAIAVIDIPSLVASDPALGGDAGQKKIEAVIQGLVDAGYVVIDSSAVLGAPERVFVGTGGREGGDAQRR